MIIKSKKNYQELKKGAIGLCYSWPSFKVFVKDGLSKNKLRKLVGLLGDRAKEFLDVEDFKFRAHFYRGDVKNIPEGALAVYDLENIDIFDVVKEKKLTKIEKAKIKNIEKEQSEL